MTTSPTDASRGELEQWLRTLLSDELNIPPETIDPHEAMSTYGLDSVKAITLLADIEDRVGFEVPPNAFWEYPTISLFTELLVTELAQTIS